MRYLLFLLTIVSLPAFAQGKWKDYQISVKGDTINRLDHKGRQQGPWVQKQEALRAERGYEEEGEYVDGLKVGPWRRYSLEGDLLALENYRFGMKDGKQVYFNLDQSPLREESWRAVDPKNPYDTVKIYDLSNPDRITGVTIVKVEPTSRRHGTWRYFDPRTGLIEQTEEYVNDKLKVKAEDEDVAPLAVSEGGEGGVKPKAAVQKEKVKPKEVMEFEKKNAGKKKVRVRDGATG